MRGCEPGYLFCYRNYPPGIYLTHEVGLNYDLLPDRTISYNGEKALGSNQSKKRITVLLRASMAVKNYNPHRKGNQPSESVQSKRNKTFSIFSNKKALMTQILFR